MSERTMKRIETTLQEHTGSISNKKLKGSQEEEEEAAVAITFTDW